MPWRRDCHQISGLSVFRRQRRRNRIRELYDFTTRWREGIGYTVNCRRFRACQLLAVAMALIGAKSTLAQEQHLTAREVIARIQAHVGIPWQAETVDTFKAGNPDAPVTGIAVTMMATLDVLQRATAAGQN